MRYSAVIFDLHNTLIPFCKEGFQCMLSEMAAELDVPGDDLARVTEEITHKSMTGAFGSITAQISHVCRLLGIQARVECVERAVTLWTDFHRRLHEQPFPGAATALERIKAAGLKTGLITNCALEAPTIWPTTKLAPLIDEAVFSCLAGIRKPDPSVYLLACEGLGIAPELCLYVDDAIPPLEGARLVGMHPVQFRPGVTDSPIWDGGTVTCAMQIPDLLGLG